MNDVKLILVKEGGELQQYGQEILDFSLTKAIENISEGGCTIYLPKSKRKTYQDFIDALSPNVILQIEICEKLEFTGFIKGIETNASKNGFAIVIVFADKLQDFIDSAIPPLGKENGVYDPSRIISTRNFTKKYGQMDLIKLTQIVLEKIGYKITDSSNRHFKKEEIGIDKSELEENIKLNIVIAENKEDGKITQGFQNISSTNLVNLNANTDIVSALGERGFEFVQKYAKRFGICITSNSKGDVAFLKPNREILQNKSDFPLLSNQIGQESNKNNVLSVKYRLNFQERFNKYNCYASLDQSIFDDESNKKDGLVATSVDTEMRSTRIFEYKAKEETTTEIMKQRASVYAIAKKARGEQFEVVVANFFWLNGKKKEVWQKNQIVHFIDDDLKVDDIFIVREIKFGITRTENSIEARTTLALVNQKYYAELSL
jgi:hypothetical protein